MGSGGQVGVVDTPSCEILEQNRLRGGSILLVDLEEGRLITDDEVPPSACLLSRRPVIYCNYFFKHWRYAILTI